METLGYKEMIDKLGLVDTELAGLIYNLYLQCIQDEKREDSDNYGRIYRNL